MGVIGPWQLLVIVALVVIFFGGKKIPELMRGMGRGIKEFKDAINKDYTACPRVSARFLHGFCTVSKRAEGAFRYKIRQRVQKLLGEKSRCLD